MKSRANLYCCLKCGNSNCRSWVDDEQHLVATCDECNIVFQIAECISNKVELPQDAKQRKNLPIYSGFVEYFPDAMIAVTELSKIGNDQHNPGKPLHWDRSKSGDEKDALMRHLLQCGTKDTDGVWHDTKVAWRAMANLQKLIEENRKEKV